MAANPTTPNLSDYVAFLTGVVGIPNLFLPTALGAATDGSTGFLADSSQNWSPDQWQGFTVSDITQGERAVIETNDPQTLSFADPVQNPVLAGDSYLISPEVVPMSLAIAREIVNETIARVSATMYVLAVYNLATDRLIHYARDVSNQTWFFDKRKAFRLNDPILGVVVSAGNADTSMSYLNPEQMKTFTLQDLESLKTPYGRAYLGIAQKYGLSIWGLS